MSAPLSPDLIAEIAARAAHLYEYVRQPAEADVLAGEDVPALLAEVERLAARVAELEAVACSCVAAEMHEAACGQSRIVVSGVEYSTAHWYRDRDGDLWMPWSTDDETMWLVAHGSGANDPVVLAEVLAEYGPLVRTEHIASTALDEIDAAEAGDPR